MSDFFGAAIDYANMGTAEAFNINNTMLSNMLAKEREKEAREENYYYNEKAANMADARTRSLYNDLYSPAAQLQQIKDAGLSPSLFYGDGGGIAGQTGAQGAGASGVMGQSFGIAPLDYANLMKLNAETGLIKAETDKTKKETGYQELENELKEMTNTQFKTEFEILNSHFATSDGKQQSLYELAEVSYSYDKFLENVREAAIQGENLYLRDATTTEQGQKVLRSIFLANSKLSRDISVLSDEKTEANFYKQLTQELQKENFAKLNANDAIQHLRTNISTNSLDEKQKEAWNNLLDKLGKGSTLQDVVIVIGMILNNALTNYGSAHIGINRSIRSEK